MAERVDIERIEQDGLFSCRWLTLADDGTLLIEGQDIGGLVEQIFGRREYEFIRTLRGPAVAQLRSLLGIESDGSLLGQLRARFSTSAELERFIGDQAIPNELWTRTGD